MGTVPISIHSFHTNYFLLFISNDPNNNTTPVAITATGFFPAPVFGGKLMAYLGQFTLGTIERALINLGACLFCAILASVVPMKLGSPLSKFGSIVRESMGFGLGIAWNIFLEGLFAPDEMDASHLIGMAGYLALLALITFRVAAQVEHIEGEEPSAIDRLWILLTFAMQTVCAFTLVAFVSALTADGWIGHIENLFILLLFAAIISTLVARIDTNSLVEQESDEDEQNCGLDHLPCILKLLVWVPCLWVCCPWIPLVFLLSGVNGVGIKEKWFNVSNMALGLAASIEASGMITEFTNEVAAGLGFCNEKHCSHPWFFVLLQVGVAAVVTIIMIPLLAAVVPEFLLPPEDDNLIDEAVAPSTVTRRRSPVEFITAIPSDTVSLLSGPSSKYSSV